MKSESSAFFTTALNLDSISRASSGSSELALARNRLANFAGIVERFVWTRLSASRGNNPGRPGAGDSKKDSARS
jgi:hypothetical protein